MFFCKSRFLLGATLVTLFLGACDPKKDAVAPRPSAAFTYAGGTCSGGCPVTLRNTSQNATSYTWSFGDNTTSTQADAQFAHSYAQPGIYRIKLTAQSSAGTDTTSQRVSVGCGTVVQVPATIAAATTWTACNVYVVSSNTSLKSTLTIEPGTVVKFMPGVNLTLSGNGRLLATGTASAPIYFTSYHDDAHGGDSNGNGAATAPARKDWRNIDLSGTTGSQFSYCQFVYGGNGGSLLNLDQGAASITNCTFAHNGEDVPVITAAALNAYSAIAGTVIQNNVFYDNVRPLSITSSLDLDDSNTFHNPANTSEKNQYQGIITFWDVNVTKASVSWAETEAAYVNIADIDLKAGKTLQVGNNVTLKFLPGVQLIFRTGASQLLNSAGAGVAYTSYKDDTRGGDSNGNGAANAPAKGDWTGIYKDPLPSSWLTWSNSYYATH